MLGGGQLAGGNSVSKKAEDDYYATDPATVLSFLKVFPHILEGKIWECACGGGNISRVVADRFPYSNVVSTDLVYRGFGRGGVDFLTCCDRADTIITNPPFSKLNEFIVHALEQSYRWVIFFAKIQTLEGVTRKKILEGSPLRYVYVHTARQATWKNGSPVDERGKKWATTMCMAWFVWDKQYGGEPIIRLI